MSEKVSFDDAAESITSNFLSILGNMDFDWFIADWEDILKQKGFFNHVVNIYENTRLFRFLLNTKADEPSYESLLMLHTKEKTDKNFFESFEKMVSEGNFRMEYGEEKKVSLDGEEVTVSLYNANSWYDLSKNFMLADPAISEYLPIVLTSFDRLNFKAMKETLLELDPEFKKYCDKLGDAISIIGIAPTNPYDHAFFCEVLKNDPSAQYYILTNNLPERMH